ncbi:NlpC/P60 family protein [Streptomyces armeniacus]|uniref:C40 family peptidase n=1 Tax=Streptomyces armeniacus TaxID=83291 RepID=UPI001AD8051B|nr:C40 family peptidase [Streptomyces armeniacus]
MSPLIPVRSVSAVAVATAAMVVVTAQPAQPVPQDRHTVRAGRPAAAAAPAEPGGRSLGELLTRMRTLYRQTEAASEAYNGAAERLKAQQAEVRRLNARLVRTRSAVDAGRAEAGRLARQQYREQAAGLPPSVQVLLADDPVRALQGGHALQRAVGRQAVAVKRLTSGERQRDALALRARGALEKQRRLAATRKAHRDAAQRRLRQVERMLAALPPERLARLRQLESTQDARAQREFLAGGALGGDTPKGGAPGGDAQAGTRAPSEQGRRALEFALAQRGKPYAWGAEGPRAYDCSGLTARAWARAGRAIPRTSQQQWRRLERVPLRELRPGDLVLYFAGATHVGLYAGQGRIVQAPRPGARVKVSPIAANPVIGAVRPDPWAPPLPSYEAPPLPADAGPDDAVPGAARTDAARTDAGQARGTEPRSSDAR